jgi:hypothetical protein
MLSQDSSEYLCLAQFADWQLPTIAQKLKTEPANTLAILE